MNNWLVFEIWTVCAIFGAIIFDYSIDNIHRFFRVTPYPETAQGKKQKEADQNKEEMAAKINYIKETMPFLYFLLMVFVNYFVFPFITCATIKAKLGIGDYKFKD